MREAESMSTESEFLVNPEFNAEFIAVWLGRRGSYQRSFGERIF